VSIRSDAKSTFNDAHHGRVGAAASYRAIGFLVIRCLKTTDHTMCAGACAHCVKPCSEAIAANEMLGQAVIERVS
jgi:hypothetical protein